jgi:hypothetical protein
MGFDYGDEVTVIVKDDSENIAEKLCCVVGITRIETREQATHFSRPIGDVLYTVEFSNGTDALIPETELHSAMPQRGGPKDQVS